MDNSKMFNEITEKFDKLVKEEKLDINAVEDLMLNDIKNYREKQKKHIEYLLKNHVNERDLIIKKNKNGLLKDLN